MAFDDAERERIRYHMGYTEVSPAAGLAQGLPVPIQTLFLVESAMDRVLQAAEDRVRKLIVILDKIECKQEEALDFLPVDQVDQTTIRKDHLDKLEIEYCRWAAKLADVMGAPLYPGATKFRWLFQGAGAGAYSVPVRG